jgi:hypothetical protein
MGQQIEAAADGGVATALGQRIAGAKHPLGERTEQLELFLFQSRSGSEAEVPASL